MLGNWFEKRKRHKKTSAVFSFCSCSYQLNDLNDKCEMGQYCEFLLMFKNFHNFFADIEMLIRDLSHFQSYIWTLCAKVVLSVRTLGPIQSEERASTFPITFFSPSSAKISTCNSWKFAKGCLVFIKFCLNLRSSTMRMGFPCGRRQLVSDCYGFKNHSMRRSKAVWINFHGTKLLRPKKFHYNIVNLCAHIVFM